MTVTINGTTGVSLCDTNSVPTSALQASAVTQPKVGSGVAGNGPAFRAHNNASQSITAATWTKVLFQVKNFDTASCFDNVTNYRFTPNVAGYYQVSVSISHNFSGANGTTVSTNLYKNGSSYAISSIGVNATGGPYGPLNLTELVYMNGSTDYLEVYAWNNNVTPTIDNSSNGTRFAACLIRSA